MNAAVCYCAMLLAMVAVTSAIVCTPDICSIVRCANIKAEDCPNGYVKEHGSFCGCCQKCITYLAENDDCELIYLTGVPPSVECGPNLACIDNKCSKVQQA